MYDFEGRTAIVTGGTRGIGRAVSEGFLEHGANVVAVYHGNDETAEKFVEDNKQSEGRVKTFKLDVADYCACETFYRESEKSFGNLWALVNCAGIRRDSVVGMMKQEDWKAVLDTNLTGTFNMSKLAVKAMIRQRRGRIISVTSPVGRLGFPGQANYGASKAGQIGFTRALSKEVAKRNITVNCVSPGFIDTDFISGLAEKRKSAFMDMVAMRRFGKPVEVANCVLFLASDMASYVTGETLEVNGGL